jgi:type I restriction enzyme, S subunit
LNIIFNQTILAQVVFDKQRRIVAYLDSVQARLASLRGLQSETQEELDALLPSVMERVFKEET